MTLKTLPVLHDTGAARAFGIFSWPSGGSAAGMCSPGCARILGVEVANCDEFRTILTKESAEHFRSAVDGSREFLIDLMLTNGRLIELVAASEGHGDDKVVNGALEDVSYRRAELEAFNAREELCRAVAENSPAMLWMGDQYGKCVFLNQAQRDFWGVDPEDLSTFDWSSTIHPADIGKLGPPFAEGMANQTPFKVEARYLRADGRYRTMRTEARPRFDRTGLFLGMTGVNTDITDQLVAEERTRMLMGELNHRTKNILSVVQAVARQTVKMTSPAEFNEAFGDRLIGLAASNDLLLRNDWSGVEMAELVEVQLAHLSDLIGARIIPSGPPLRIAPAAAQTLGMALHELSTNSLKYGALGSAEGQVALTWERSGDPSATGFNLSWVETGVTDVARPSQKGFGHAVIVDMVSSALDADVEIRFDQDGFKWLVRTRSDVGLAA